MILIILTNWLWILFILWGDVAVRRDGFSYQQEVSVWAALDLLPAKQLAKHLVLEPATEEDLETDIEDEPGHLAENIDLNTYRLVIQCKLRNTGPWKHGDLSRLLAHGTVRVSPKARQRPRHSLSVGNQCGRGRCRAAHHGQGVRFLDRSLNCCVPARHPD
jgi:hypothetical protein